MKILEREIGSISYAANQTRTLQLPRNYAYDALSLKLVCQLDRVAGATGGAPKDCCPGQLVKNITIRCNGRDVIKLFDTMESLHRLNQINHGIRPYISFADFSGYDVKSDSVLAIHAMIDFAMWNAIRSIDTLLDSAGLATLEFIITWGAGDDVMNDAYDPAAGGVTVDSATLYLSSIERVGVPAGTRFGFNKEYMIRKEVTAASTSFQIDLPVGNMFRQFVLKTHSDGNQVDTILNNIQIKSGTEVFKNRIAALMQMDNRILRGFEVPEIDSSAAAVDHYYLEHLLEGYYLLEFVRDGRLTECLNTQKLSSLELLLDVAHPGTTDFVDIFPVELILPAEAV